jgi:2-desacetyl-2-hydroxyethyl bacteriochlorophyllide A dehydrogenase
MRSRAVVFTARNKVEFLEVQCPEPGPGDVVIDVEHSWISNGTEGSFLRGERTSGDTAWRPGDPEPFPIVAGYQKTGRITAIGSGVTQFTVGERVFAVMSKLQGLFADYGGHVSPSVCDTRFVHKLPVGADPLACCGCVLTQVGYNCGTRPRLAPGGLAVVIGDGLVGQWAGQALKQRGARVVMTGRHEDRLARFRAGGWGETVLVPAGAGVAEVTMIAAGPVEVLVDTVGDLSLYEAWLPHMRHGGTVASAGFYGTQDLLPIQRYRFRELAFDLVAGATRERIDATLQWIADGKMDTLGLITHRFPAGRAAEAWDLIRSKRDGVLGVVLDWR